MTSDELLQELIRKLGDKFIVETSYSSWMDDKGPMFRTIIKRRYTGEMIYECLTPKQIGTNTYERSKEKHLEIVFTELMVKWL